MVARICVFCGAGFRVAPRQVARKNGALYCSNRCRGNAQSGKDHPQWKGGQRIASGYLLETVGVGKYRGVHVLIAERALGKPLPRTRPVHHVDGNRQNNVNTNLVICESHRYHMLLHARARIVRAGGNPNTDKICATCQIAKPHSWFTSDRSRPDGFEKHCRPCKRTIDQRSRQISVGASQ